MSGLDAWEECWGSLHGSRLVQPTGCQECGIPEREHHQRWSSSVGWHHWTMPTQRQIKYRMIRRKHHGATRWMSR